MAAHVKRLATHFNAHLTLLHAWLLPDNVNGPWDWASEKAADLDDVERGFLESLTAFGEKHFTGFDPERLDSTIRQGDPGCAISEVARENRIDLVMLATQGAGVFRRALSASVTARVLHDTDCHVWTSSRLDSEEPPASYKTVLCAVIPICGAAKHVRAAGSLAQEFGARLYFVCAVNEHAVPGRETPPEMRATAYEQVIRIVEEQQTSGEVIIESGNVDHVVRQTALNIKADLVVIGRGHSKVSFGGIRSHTFAIIRESPCPIWSV
jgi:nucleotide-binding universal stress UspA family protein